MASFCTQVIGAGLAGSAAAIAARQNGAGVHIFDQSALPRHKVCGEFLSPEIFPILERLGAAASFLAQSPARIRRMRLHFGSRTRTSALPEPAWGLSRFALDRMLLDRAVETGAEFVQKRRAAGPSDFPVIWAAGRNTVNSAPKGARIFGFKAHYEGPAEDAVELFFFNGCYIGLNAIEGGRTNLCGLGPEHLLRSVAFDIDTLIGRSAPLRERLRPLNRCMEFHHTGPLVFGNCLSEIAADRFYPAGDALSFVDPFTGSGQLGALLTGELAGRCAATRVPSAEYLAECRRILHQPFAVSTLFRSLAHTPWAEWFAPLIPGRWLFDWTRPRTT